jgi:hypothetical protein
VTGIWGNAARQHWQQHLPARYAALEDPDWFFADLDQQASAYYQAIRDAQLEGVSPNNGTISWAEFLNRVNWANEVAREIVEHELIYFPGEDDDEDDGEVDDIEGADW